MSHSIILELLTAALMVVFYLYECTRLVRRVLKKMGRVFSEKLRMTAKVMRTIVLICVIIVLTDPVIFYLIHFLNTLEHASVAA